MISWCPKFKISKTDHDKKRTKKKKKAIYVRELWPFIVGPISQAPPSHYLITLKIILSLPSTFSSTLTSRQQISALPWLSFSLTNNKAMLLLFICCFKSLVVQYWFLMPPTRRVSSDSLLHNPQGFLPLWQICKHEWWFFYHFFLLAQKHVLRGKWTMRRSSCCDKNQVYLYLFLMISDVLSSSCVLHNTLRTMR